MPNLLKCRIEDCHVLKYTVPSPGVVEGQMGLLGNGTVYAWLEDYETGDIGVKIIEAERITLPAASAATFAIGDWVYFDTGTLDLNATGGGRYRCGVCRVAKVALELTVEVDFWGNKPVLV